MDELLGMYSDGLYTAGEVSSVCIKTLALARDDAKRTAIWAQMPPWLQDSISAIFARVDYEHDETISFGHSDDTPNEFYVRAQHWHRNLRA
ncbi:hypothetical protein J5226_20025 [Lysobacter sp. K5869]|uniref:hypothetical protein n=1 Tax=Lysobacter sp. K5869 TaxID=2820808 RepID=UPI001C0602C1|nr:hypothetical protein [Lysobacter sp. K5869]QWP75871.1 hypothetical protein J5226_20025 [Lysobacter sp. K5869]